MNYEETVLYLKECSLLGSRPGLESIRELLSRLGNPQRQVRVIHVVGTNGKGSVSSFIVSVLTAAGYRTGFFASPAVYHLTETICINRKPISCEALADVISRVRIEADAMQKDGLSHPTEFEIITAGAYLYFAEQKCDCAVLEAGMGGRLDATNVTETALAAVLTRIDYDHLGFLGETLTEIAKEKCGVLKRGVPLIMYPDQEIETVREIQSQTARYESMLHTPDVSALTLHEQSATGSVFSYKQYHNLRILLCGPHQVFNAITAIETIETLKESGLSCSEQQLREGLAQAQWSGRFELLSVNPPIVLDGAHNLNGARAFTETVRKVFPNQTFIGIVGMLKDKDYEASLSLFGTICNRLILTKVPNPRSAEGQELAQAAQKLGLTVLAVTDTPQEAVRQAFLHRTEEEGVFCVGSLYALAEYKNACEKAFR